MNQVFLAVLAIAFASAAVTGTMTETSAAALEGAKKAVELAISLVGYMALFLGVMKVGEDAGLLRLLARLIRPVMVRLFPDVPPEHPAMGAMILNIAANMLGLGNAATPLGIKAMQELEKLNDRPGVATNAMVLFLAINTSGLAILPSGVVSVRASLGSQDPWGIVGPTLLATTVSTVVAITAALLLARTRWFARERYSPVSSPEAKSAAVAAADADLDQGPEPSRAAVWALGLFLATTLLTLAGPPLLAAVLPASHPWGPGLREFASTAGGWVVPSLILSVLGYAAWNGQPVYERFVAGARAGFDTGVRIIPFLVAILTAVGMFRASGAMEGLGWLLSPATSALGFPAEAVPMAVVRPLSGSGAFGLMTEVMESQGPDSYAGYVVSVLNGSTETTFYVLAVYFGSVGITKVRHAVVAGLSADVAGAVATALVCAALFGHLA